MKKKLAIVFIMLALAVVLGAKTKVIPMPDLMKPGDVQLDKTQMYVVEDTSISIYSLKDFKLIKKFGKRGEGPQEFMIDPRLGPLVIDVSTDDIVINSLGKLSWFSKDGTFKKEMKTPSPLILGIRPFGKNFIGLFFESGQERWQVQNLYDPKLNKIKEIIRKKHSFQPGKGLRMLDTPPTTAIYGDKIFLAWENEFSIKVLDSDLKELYTIKRDEKKHPVTEKDKEIFMNELKTNPATKDVLQFLKPITFPDHFPAVLALLPMDDKLYAFTFHRNEAGSFECLLMDLKGKLLKRFFLPLKMSAPFQPYPAGIHNGAVYQLVEDIDEEEWALHITEIK